MGAVKTPTETVVIGVTAVVAWAVMEHDALCPWWAILAVLEQYCKPCPLCREWCLVNGADLNQRHAIGADDLCLASLRAVNGWIDSHVMGNMGGSAASSGNHVSHAITFAVSVGGTLMETVEEHCKAPS